MSFSIFNLFTVGIGPSSSHTVGPMRAAHAFAQKLKESALITEVAALRVDLYGSLALTGRQHSYDSAIMAGLLGEAPDSVDPVELLRQIDKVKHNHKLLLLGEQSVPFICERQIIFHMDRQLPYHPNGMRFTAFDCSQRELLCEIYYSVGGGTVIDHTCASREEPLISATAKQPYPFKKCSDLMLQAENHSLTIAELMMANEEALHSRREVIEMALNIWEKMKECTAHGCEAEGVLPGNLGNVRKASSLHKLLTSRSSSTYYPADARQWISAWALAVGEENASGGRVVSAPTNGGAGIVSSLLHYYIHYSTTSSEQGVVTFLLAAGAIGLVCKGSSTPSTSERGCSGEVGVASAMAAAGLTAAIGGSNSEVEAAAAMAIEHNLGLTCDPLKGIVQFPCIERNVFGAIKALCAVELAKRYPSNKTHSLDQMIMAMQRSTEGMRNINKVYSSNTALTVDFPEC